MSRGAPTSISLSKPRASEIPHAFRKFGLRIYTSPVNFQVANAALANKEQGLYLKDQTIQDAYQVRLFRTEGTSSSPVEVRFQSAVTNCYTALQIDLHSHSPNEAIYRSICAAISPGFFFGGTQPTKNSQGQIRLVGIIDVPHAVPADEVCKYTSVTIQESQYLFTILYLGELANVSWRKEPASSRFEDQIMHWRNAQDRRLVPEARIGALLPLHESDALAFRRLASSCFGKVRDISFYHLPASAGSLPVLAYHPQRTVGHATEDYEEIISIASSQCAAAASFFSPILSEGLLQKSCELRNAPGNTGIAILYYSNRTLVDIPIS